MVVAKEQIWQIIAENNISSVEDVYALLKNSFIMAREKKPVHKV